MPKLIAPISAPRQRGKDFKKYMCHPTVLKNMLINLEKMPYITETDRLNFKIQTFKILSIIALWWIRNGENICIYLLSNLFHYLGGEGCMYEGSEVTIFNCDTPSAKIYYSSYSINKKLLKTCKNRFFILSLTLRNIDPKSEGHTNLLVIDLQKEIAWRIEPNNGPNWDGYSQYVNPILKVLCKDLGISFKGNYTGECPIWISKIPNFVLKYLPVPERRSNYLPHAGLCMFLSVGRYIYGSKLTDEILTKYIIGFIKSEMKKICN